MNHLPKRTLSPSGPVKGYMQNINHMEKLQESFHDTERMITTTAADGLNMYCFLKWGIKPMEVDQLAGNETELIGKQMEE